MASIYIIYAKEDRKIAENLFNLLSRQWDTWWDDSLVGQFTKIIETELPKAGCAVALVSGKSRIKDTFVDELRLAKKHGKEILPLSLDGTDTPYPFGSYSMIELKEWNGGPDHAGFKQLLRRLSTIIPPKERLKRPAFIADAALPLPSLFLSVSSHDTQLPPPDAIRALQIFGVPAILISAYDLIAAREPRATIREIKRYRANGGFVLIDSGNYEASRLRDKTWTPDNLHEVLSTTPHDWVFCFDVMDPSLGKRRCVKEIVDAVIRDQKFTTSPVLPIVHAPRLRQGEYKLDHIPYVIREVSEILKPPLIAIPERELGGGIIARARMTRLIREELSKLPHYQPLHILGTGNPWSIAILAAAGADTFDGLEWCRFTVDPELERINHFHHFDLLPERTANSALVQAALDDPSIGFSGGVALHNLDYFKIFAGSMHSMFIDGSIESFVQGVIEKKAFAKLKTRFPEIFQ